MDTRLELVAPDLVQRLSQASDQGLRSAATAAALLAVDRAGLRDPRVSKAEAVLREGRAPDATLLKSLRVLTEELDEEQWRLQEKVEAGGGSEDAHLSAFARARVASALYFAIEGNALRAALEAVCESHAATGDLDELQTTVLQAIELAAR